ncbi:MAG: hypothetical protein ACI902_002085 [Psychroserpens sp.]|jgi:hypothetical protein
MFSSLYLSLFCVSIFVFLTIQFSLLRRKEVTKESYYLVLIGVLFLLMSRTSVVLSMFNKALANQDVSTMLLYAIVQYITVIGIINEKKLSIS